MHATGFTSFKAVNLHRSKHFVSLESASDWARKQDERRVGPTLIFAFSVNSSQQLVSLLNGDARGVAMRRSGVSRM